MEFNGTFTDLDSGDLAYWGVRSTSLGIALTLRARAGRSSGWAPAVGPLGEFDGDDECDGEGDLVEAVVDEAVGVAA